MSMRKCFKDQQFYDDYVRFMRHIIEKGYSKKVALSCLKTEEGKVWYLPHLGIYHPKKPEKIRGGFYCICQYESRSLNKELLQGPEKPCFIKFLCLRNNKATYVLFDGQTVISIKNLMSMKVCSPFSSYKALHHVLIGL